MNKLADALAMVYVWVMGGSCVLGFTLALIDDHYKFHGAFRVFYTDLLVWVFLPMLGLFFFAGWVMTTAENIKVTGRKKPFLIIWEMLKSFGRFALIILLIVAAPILLPFGYLDDWLREKSRRKEKQGDVKAMALTVLAPELALATVGAHASVISHPMAVYVTSDEEDEDEEDHEQQVVVEPLSAPPVSRVPTQMELPEVSLCDMASKPVPKVFKKLDFHRMPNPSYPGYPKLEWDPRWPPWAMSLAGIRVNNPCPKCGSGHVALLLYGHFGGRSAYLTDLMEAGFIRSGGCMGGQEDMSCRDCGFDFIHYDDSIELPETPSFLIAGAGISFGPTHAVCAYCGHKLPLRRLRKGDKGEYACFPCIKIARDQGALD